MLYKSIQVLLAKLLCTLSDEEITKIREDFRLSERACLIFERIAASASSPPSAERLTKAFGISKENLYRLTSEIASECVRILAPKEEFATMIFYRSKYLYRPFVTELRRLEKELLRSGADREVLERFYNYAFNEGRNFPTGVIDLDLTQEMGKKWFASQLHPPTDEDLYIDLRVISSRIGALTSHKKMSMAQMKQQAEELLIPYRQRAPNSPNLRAVNEYYQAEWKACAFDRSNLDKGTEWLKRSLALARKDPDWFIPGWDQTLEQVIAYELAIYCGKGKEGLEIFKKYYQQQTPDSPRGALYLFRYIRVAFLARDFTKTKELLDRLDGFQVIRSTPVNYKISLMFRANLLLATGELHEARRTIEHARSINTEYYFLDHDVVLRGFETMIAFKAGDHEEADKLITRNIKWHHSRRIGLGASAWIYFYQMVAALIRNMMTGEPIRPLTLAHFTNDFRTEYPEFAFLLEQEIKDITENENEKNI